MTSFIKSGRLEKRNSLVKNLKRLGSLVLLSNVFLVFGGTAHADPLFFQVAGGTSSDAPALTTLNGVAVMAIRANDNTDAMWWSIAQTNWEKIPSGTTKAAPTLITWGTKVILFSTGEDGNPYFMRLSNSTNSNVLSWAFNSSWEVVPGAGGQLNKALRPAVTVVGNNLYLFTIFADKSIHYSVASMDSAGNISWCGTFTEVPGSGFTTESVSAVTSANTLTVIQTGTDQNPYAQSLDLTTNVWGNAWTKLPFLTDALGFSTTSSLIDASHIAFCGIDINLERINCARLTVTHSGTSFAYAIGSATEINTVSAPPIPTITHSPTLTFLGGDLVMLAATINNPTTGQPQVEVSSAGTYTSVVTPGENPQP